MAVCPNCGRKLRMTDWKPDCPECGVNLNYFNANERLLVDSEKAEREHARFQPSVDRGKASYAGSKLAILRIVFTLLPVGALFLPLCSKLADGKTTGVNVIDVYKFVSSGDIGAILGAGAFGVSIALLLLSAVMILVCIISIIASLGKHGKGRTIALYSVMAGSAALSLICFLISFPKFGDLFPEMNTVVGGVGIGGITMETLMPEKHFLRDLDRLVDFSFVYDKVEGFYSRTGRRSVDPVVIVKMMLLGYLYGIDSERRLEQELLGSGLCSCHRTSARQR